MAKKKSLQLLAKIQPKIACMKSRHVSVKYFWGAKANLGEQIFFVYSGNYMVRYIDSFVSLGFCNSNLKKSRFCLLFTAVNTFNYRSYIHFASNNVARTSKQTLERNAFAFCAYNYTLHGKLKQNI